MMLNNHYKPKQLSCGIIIINSKREVLILRGEGNDHWDIPKGRQDDNETIIEAALRETKEETGLVIPEDQLVDISWFPYSGLKELYLYVHQTDNIKIDSLRCSAYTMRNGIGLLEAEEYKFVSLDDLHRYMCGSMQRLLENELKKSIIRAIN